MSNTSFFPIRFRNTAAKCVLLGVGFSCLALDGDSFAQTEAATVRAVPDDATTAFELPPVVRTVDLLEPQLMQGPYHRVRELAATDGYLAQVVIDSDYGIFICSSAAQARQRITEIYAIQKLIEVSKSDLFAEGLKRSVAQPVAAVKNIIKNPSAAVKEVPHSVGHFFKRLGRTIENAAESAQTKMAESKQSDQPPVERLKDAGKTMGEAAKNALGYDQAKLECAHQLQVDPYSDNSRLQEEMDKVTWAFFGGGLPLKIGMATATGGVSTAVSATEFVGLPDEVYRMDSGELELRNFEALKAMRVPAEVIRHFSTNTILTPTLRQSLLRSLQALPPVQGRVSIVALAATCTTLGQAQFLDRSLQLLAVRQATGKASYTELLVAGNLPGARERSGQYVVPAPVDYISWTESVADFARRDDLTSRQPTLLLTGSITEKAMAGFTRAGWSIVRP